MKTCVSILFIFALSAPSFTSAQDKASNDLNTLLRDASYVFNRFEEVSAGVRMQIDVHYPVQLREGTKEALSGTLKSVAKEKPALNAILDHANVSSADLLDVYTEIMEVASELDAEASNNNDWGDEKLAIDLAQLGAKAEVLGAKLGITLRSQIATQELQLASCKLHDPAHEPE